MRVAILYCTLYVKELAQEDEQLEYGYIHYSTSALTSSQAPTAASRLLAAT